MRTSRLLALIAAGLAITVLIVVAYRYNIGAAPWQARPLPQIVRGASEPTPLPKIIRGPSDPVVRPGEITIVDGDTIRARGRTIRLSALTRPRSACSRHARVSVISHSEPAPD